MSIQMKLLLLAIALAICVLSVDGWNKNKASSKIDDPTGDDDSDDNCHCPCHHHHYHHPKMPAFLKKVSFDARWEYYGILRNLLMSMNEKLKRIHEWAKKQGPEIEKGVDEYFNKIEEYWKDVNKNTTMILEKLPEVYPKVYEIMSDLDLTPREIYSKIKDLHMDTMTAHSLYALVMAVIHTGGADYPYQTDTEMFFEKIATPKIRNLFYRYT
ncbi:hypothetical protein V3C99_014071 [Haemonchus contortus]